MMTNGPRAAFPVDYAEVHSPTDSSEDSVEVKVSPIALRNKRKCAEPRKVQDFLGPLKKRVCLQVRAESEGRPFRPWSPPPPGFFRPPSPPKEPVALVKREEAPRVPAHPAPALTPAEAEREILRTVEAFPGLGRREQRNYKNMTRERRIEANARERTRVHTISAAFDTLRKSIPSYSHNQKLSKMSVLRIACSYIMTLSSVVNGDEEATTECVDLVTKTIQREGKLRKKKDDND